MQYQLLLQRFHVRLFCYLDKTVLTLHFTRHPESRWWKKLREQVFFQRLIGNVVDINKTLCHKLQEQIHKTVIKGSVGVGF